MNEKEKRKKEIEYRYITKYMEECHKITPQYIEQKNDIPDGYFVNNDKYWAVEAVSYFMDEKEKNHQILKKISEVYNDRKENIFKLYFENIGKKYTETITIQYGDKDRLIKDIIEGEECILGIMCKNQYWSEIIKKEYRLNTFLKNVIEDDIYLNVTLKEKYKHNVNIRIHYSTIFNGRKISDIYVWWENEEKYINSVISAIESKIGKYEEYVKRMLELNQKFDRYCLVVYPQNIPADINEEKIRNAIKNKFDNIKYDEIMIYLWNKKVLIEKNK